MTPTKTPCIIAPDSNQLLSHFQTQPIYPNFSPTPATRLNKQWPKPKLWSADSCTAEQWSKIKHSHERARHPSYWRCSIQNYLLILFRFTKHFHLAFNIAFSYARFICDYTFRCKLCIHKTLVPFWKFALLLSLVQLIYVSRVTAHEHVRAVLKAHGPWTRVVWIELNAGSRLSLASRRPYHYSVVIGTKIKKAKLMLWVNE